MDYVYLLKDMIKKSPATTFLFALLVVSFAGSYVWGAGADDLDTARYFGAITVFDATTDQFIRTITSIFQQIGGPIHLLLNLLALLVTGPFLERIYGPVKYMVFFLVTGMFGSIATLMFSDVNVISAGASGSVYGLMGLYLGLVLKKDPWINTDMKHWVWNLIWINLVWTFFVPGISITGHMGGLISGVIIAGLFETKQINHLNWFGDFIKAAVTFVAVVVFACVPKMVWPNTVLPFIQEIREKFDLPTIYDAPNQFSDELVYNFLSTPAAAPEKTTNISLENVSSSMLEIIITLLLLLLVWKSIRRVITGLRIKKLIKNSRQFEQAKVHKIDPFINQIGNEAIFRYSASFKQPNKKRLFKITEFELQMYFGTVFQKIRNSIVKIVRLAFIGAGLLLIAIFASITYDNLTANTIPKSATEQRQSTEKTAPSKNNLAIINGKVIFGYANIPLETVFNNDNFSKLQIHHQGNEIFISGKYKYELLSFRKPSLDITLSHQYEHHYVTMDVLINGIPVDDPLSFMDELLNQHGDTNYTAEPVVYTEDEAIEHLFNYGYIPSGYKVMSHGLEGDDYVIRVFEDMETHIATLHWYYVNKYTLDVYEMEM